MSKLSNLFDEKLKRQNDLVASAPQTLENVSLKPEEQELVLHRLSRFDTVDVLVDYSDFKNFVFFNSALDYFNLTGEKLLNEYPYDGTVDQLEEFVNDLDGYQRYVVEKAWPKNSSHLRFNPSKGRSFLIVDDIGVSAGTSRSAILSPNTGSFSIDFWCQPPPALTGSNDVMFVVQKVSGTSGYSVFFSGSNIFFRMASGSFSNTVSSPVNPGEISYFSCVFDRVESTPTMTMISGNRNEFPVVVSSGTVSISGPISLSTNKLAIASGTLAGKVTRWLTGSLDNVKLWSQALTLVDLTSSFNAKTHAQTDLLALWRFNETALTSSLYPAGGDDVICLDYSGHRLNARIQNYFVDIRSSGSLVSFESPDMNLFFNSPEVQDYISEQQVSGTAYDRDNDNIITKMLPEDFFVMEDFKNTEVLRNFVYVYARQFDFLKIQIDQFLNVMKVNYSKFNQVPDALLADIGRFFGWDFSGNFLNADAFQYLFGKGVLAGVDTNKELDTKLFEIKNDFWRRTLNNLMYIYKTKGTRESVESLLRIYGVNQNFIKLKEFGVPQNVGISTSRIFGEKSVNVLTFGSGSVSGSNYVSSENFPSIARTIETRVKFPTTGSEELEASILTGSIWTLNSSSIGPMLYQLQFTKDGVGNQTGSLIFSSSDGQLILSSANIFDNKWYNIAVVREHRSSSFTIEVRSIDDGSINKHLSTTKTVGTFDSDVKQLVLWLGSTGSLKSQYWMQEARVWDEPLSTVELDDHALNYQSYGTEEVDGLPQLSVHWRLNEDVVADVSGDFVNQVIDISSHGVSGSGYGFIPERSPYNKFLNEYNFIASPDYGWSEDKIRVLLSSKVKPEDMFTDDRNISLEFNLVDALNEDISQILASLDGFNNSLGLPANKYRATYQDLSVLRENYFKRLQGSLNFRVFSDMLEFFDRSFIDMVRRLIPARALFLGDEFVVESHMLERPKLQWNYRRAPAKFEPEGVIKIIVR